MYGMVFPQISPPKPCVYLYSLPDFSLILIYSWMEFWFFKMKVPENDTLVPWKKPL
jgi:hypothetical protein